MSRRYSSNPFDKNQRKRYQDKTTEYIWKCADSAHFEWSRPWTNTAAGKKNKHFSLTLQWLDLCCDKQKRCAIVIIENNNTTPDNYQVTFFHVRCNLFESDDS